MLFSIRFELFMHKCLIVYVTVFLHLQSNDTMDTVLISYCFY